jgi:putative heme-binding domain-containing protein
MRCLSALLVSWTASTAFAQDIAPTNAKTPEEERKTFKLPPGFEAQLVASEPDITKPMQIAFDAKGRLWVTTSKHYPFAAETGKASDKLFVLSDFAENGKAKKVEVFDNKLNIPIGILPLPDCKSCIVSSVGEILKLTDTDGDGKADQREVLFTGFGTRDTHGMYNSFTLLPDGWVYACHGYLNTSKVKGKDGHEVEMNSGNTFRFRPDGSRIEVYTRGQVNPFGMTVDPWGNLYTADCHSKPITQLIRGAYYDSFGKPHDGLGYAPHVTRHDHGSTAICGLAWYQADHYPKEFDGCMFLGNVITNRINADKIEWKGSTPVAKELPDFLISGDPWFRPTDIKLGPDGALYVSDFYNKIIGHYEVDLKHPQRDRERGRVWRIIAKDKPLVKAKDWTKVDAAELWNGFAQTNIASRLMAANEYVRRATTDPSFAIKPELNELNTTAIGLYAMASETLKRPDIKPEDYRSIVRDVHKEIEKQPTAFTGMTIRAMNSKPSWSEIERSVAIDCLHFDTAHAFRRAAIDGITAHPHGDFVSPLLAMIPTIRSDDEVLRQSAKIALRNSLAVAPEAFQTKDVFYARENPKANEVMVGVCLGLPTIESAEHLARAFLFTDLPGHNRGVVAEHIGRHGGAYEAQYVAAFVRNKQNNPTDIVWAVRGYLFGTRAANKPLFIREAIDECVIAGIDSQDSKLVVAALTALKELPQHGRATFEIAAGKLAKPNTHADVKLAACDAVFAINSKEAAARLTPLCFDAAEPMAVREKAATLAATVRETNNVVKLTEAIKTAPYRLAVVLSAGVAADRSGAELLLAAVKKGEAPARVLQERAVQDRFKAIKLPDWEAKVAELTKGLPAADARLAALIRDRTNTFGREKRDAVKGKELYAKHCAACHQLANQGGKVGPNLDGIGIRGGERLLEDILDPNRNVDVNFRSTTLNLADGRTISGLLLREEGAVLVMADNEGKESRFNKADVEKRTTTNLSPMPADWGEKLKSNDLFDLLAFVLEQKAK